MRLALVLGLALAALSCGTTSSTCTAATCRNGCCDVSGVCRQPGSTTCGMSGSRCVECTLGQICSAGACVPFSAGVGGGAGSVGGGSVGGGSVGGGSVGGGSVGGGSAGGGSVGGGSIGGGSVGGGSVGGGSAGGSVGGGSVGGGSAGGGSAGGGSAGGGSTTARCSAHALPCASNAITELNLLTVAAPAGLVTSTPLAGGGFTSTVDARVGGISPTTSGVYVRFTRTGLVQAALDDVQAQTSFDWDLTFRRVTIRLNGGDSGQSCVDAAALPPGTQFTSVTTPPVGLTFREDDFYDGTCTFIPDASGLSLPATVLESWFAYQSCLTTTGRVFVIRTRTGDLIALTIDQYYQSAASQQTCNQTGTVPGGSVSAVFTLRWRYLN